MILVKLFIGAYVFLLIGDEMIKMKREGDSREGIVKLGLLIIMEIWAIGG